MRRLRRQPQASQPLHRRYRVYILIPLLLGYAMIYGCRSAPLRWVDRPEVRYHLIDDGETAGEGKGIHGGSRTQR
jgi:hypothetical protein